MATLYGHNLGCGGPPSEIVMMTQIVELEQELSDWQQSLPHPLFLRNSSNLPGEEHADDQIMERFRLVLTLRYLNVQLLLHRPSLAASLGKRPTEGGLSGRSQRSVNQMQVTFNRTCVGVAEEIIEIVHGILTRPAMGRRLIGAWWFTMYYSECPDADAPFTNPFSHHLFHSPTLPVSSVLTHLPSFQRCPHNLRQLPPPR